MIIVNYTISIYVHFSDYYDNLSDYYDNLSDYYDNLSDYYDNNLNSLNVRCYYTTNNIS